MQNVVKIYSGVIQVISFLKVDFNGSLHVDRKPKMIDIEVFALSLTAEFISKS